VIYWFLLHISDESLRKFEGWFGFQFKGWFGFPFIHAKTTVSVFFKKIKILDWILNNLFSLETGCQLLLKKKLF